MSETITNKENANADANAIINAITVTEVITTPSVVVIGENKDFSILKTIVEEPPIVIDVPKEDIVKPLVPALPEAVPTVLAVPEAVPAAVPAAVPSEPKASEPVSTVVVLSTVARLKINCLSFWNKCIFKCAKKKPTV